MKTHFSFVSACHIQESFLARNGDMYPLPLLVLGLNLAWTCTGPVHAAMAGRDLKVEEHSSLSTVSASFF